MTIEVRASNPDYLVARMSDWDRNRGWDNTEGQKEIRVTEPSASLYLTDLNKKAVDLNPNGVPTPLVVGTDQLINSVGYHDFATSEHLVIYPGIEWTTIGPFQVRLVDPSPLN